MYLPAAALVELEREMARARLTELALVLAFVDVERLKAINGSHGHAAGDRMLLEVAETLGSRVRSYDLLYPPGGDAFIWAFSGLDMASVTERLALVNAALADAPEPGLVRFGLAELRPGDLPEDPCCTSERSAAAANGIALNERLRDLMPGARPAAPTNLGSGRKESLFAVARLSFTLPGRDRKEDPETSRAGTDRSTTGCRHPGFARGCCMAGKPFLSTQRR